MYEKLRVRWYLFDRFHHINAFSMNFNKILLHFAILLDHITAYMRRNVNGIGWTLRRAHINKHMQLYDFDYAKIQASKSNQIIIAHLFHDGYWISISCNGIFVKWLVRNSTTSVCEHFPRLTLIVYGFCAIRRYKDWLAIFWHIFFTVMVSRRYVLC